VELSDYVSIVRRYWRVILGCVMAALLFASIDTMVRPKVYQADAAGFVASGAASSTVESSISDALVKSRVASYVVVAKSPGTAREAAKILGSDAPPSSLIGRIAVSQPRETVLIQVKAKGSSPTAASELANAWIQALATQVEEIEGTGAGAMRVVPQESAMVPTRPISPNPRREMPIALALGLLVGLGAAVARSQLDRRLRRPDDVRALGLTVLSTIPATRALDRSTGRIPLLGFARGSGTPCSPSSGSMPRSTGSGGAHEAATPRDDRHAERLPLPAARPPAAPTRLLLVTFAGRFRGSHISWAS